MSLYSFSIGGITAHIEENEDRAGVYVHVEKRDKWGTLHCIEATGEWSSDWSEVTPDDDRTLEKIRDAADEIMAENGWEE